MSEQPIVVEGEGLPEGITEPEAVPAVVNTEDATNSEDESQNTEGDQPRRLKGVEKRISELTGNWREAERRAERAEARLDIFLKEKEVVKPTPQQQPQQDAEPVIDNFKTYEEYVKAVGRYEAKQEFAQQLSRQEAERAQAEAARQKEAQRSTFQAKAEQFSTTTPDFDEVAFNPSLPVSDVMADALNLSDKGPEILYHLGKHPDEALRISKLQPVQAALEIGRLEARLSLPQPRTVTKAPPPIAPLSGGSGSMIVDPDKMSTDEWRRWREAEIRKR